MRMKIKQTEQTEEKWVASCLSGKGVILHIVLYLDVSYSLRYRIVNIA